MTESGRGGRDRDALAIANEHLAAARTALDELEQLQGQLAQIEDGRQRVEAELAAAAESASEHGLNELLGRLRQLERAREQCLAAIDGRADASARWTYALAQKLALLRADGRAVVQEVDTLDAQLNAIAEYIAKLDAGLAQAEDALQQMGWLESALATANGWSLADLFVPAPADALPGVAKHGALADARQATSVLVRSLQTLEQTLDGVLVSDQPVLDLRNVGLARSDAPRWFSFFSDVLLDHAVDAGIERWSKRIAGARPALEELHRALLAGQQRAQRAFAELDARREQLIGNA